MGVFLKPFGGEPDRTYGLLSRHIWSLALTPDRPTPCPIRPNKIYDPISSHRNPSGNRGPDRREGQKMEPGNLNHRRQICLRHTLLYVLANMAGKRSALIQTAHPCLETINKKTELSAFLGLRSDRRVILIDKVDSAYGIKVSSEIGMQMPILAGAGIKAMLSQLSDEEIDEILARTELKRYTPCSIIDKAF